MDNSFSQPSLVTPIVPDNADALSGTTKRDLIVYIMSILQGAQITGITQSEPNPLDITQLASDLTALENRVEVTEERTFIIRKFLTSVPNDTTQIITFADIGTTDYEINVICSPSVASEFPQWSLVGALKTSTGFRLRFTGMATGVTDVEITIRKTDVTYS